MDKEVGRGVVFYFLLWKESQRTVNVSGDRGLQENFTFYFLLFYTIKIFLIKFMAYFI